MYNSVNLLDFKIWNLRVQKNTNAEKIFKVVQMKCLAMHITKQNIFLYLFLYIYGKKITKYLYLIS